MAFLAQGAPCNAPCYTKQICVVQRALPATTRLAGYNAPSLVERAQRDTARRAWYTAPSQVQRAWPGTPRPA